MRRILLLLIVGMAALAFTRLNVRAQSDAKPLAFEVASVKPNKSGDSGGGARLQPGGLYTVTNLSVVSLINVAFGYEQPLFRSQIVGAPPWLATRFDVIARAPSGHAPSRQDLGVMLRTLLEDRFKLKTHKETRQEQIYALVRARTDGRLGPGLHESGVDCLALGQKRRDDPSSAAPSPPICREGFGGPPGTVSGAMQVSNLVETLAAAVDRVVIDHSGLTGTLEVDLRWTPGVPGATDSDAVSIFTAAQEQLGLKLESTTGPVDVLVIDHVERPTAD
jgi:uncharacterized protein (TIGR03435 family)